jgi:hypothetical protein
MERAASAAAGEEDRMSDILKTWPAFMDSRKVLRVFNHPWANFYFSVGKGKPKEAVERLWYTHRGRILGYFRVRELKQNDGSFPKLRSITGEVSEWQFKPDIWVAICHAPFVRLEERVYHSGFRGWRYFDLEQYKSTPESRINF